MINQRGQWWIPIAAIIVIIVLVGGVVLMAQNQFVTLDNKVDEKYANLQADYQRRVDLIPNVVATVKGAGDFEQETLLQLSELRTRWQTNPEARVETANEIESTLSKLLIVSENYPTLQTSQAYRDLIVELEGTENRIKFSRDEYNAAVREYNTSIQQLPSAWLAPLFGFKERPSFELITPGAENAPVVDFNR